MDTLQITTEQLNQTATTIRSHNQQLNFALQEIQTIMNQLTDSWQSPASQTLRNRFQAMRPIFENYRVIVDSYANFLNQTVTAYQTMEHQLQSHADTFK